MPCGEAGDPAHFFGLMGISGFTLVNRLGDRKLETLGVITGYIYTYPITTGSQPWLLTRYSPIDVLLHSLSTGCFKRKEMVPPV